MVTALASSAVCARAVRRGRAGEAPEPLTEAFHRLSTEHDGSTLFGFGLRFGEEICRLRFAAFNVGALEVANERPTHEKSCGPLH